MRDDELILVDLFDRQIGSGEKLQVHRQGQLHRAFSVFVIHDGKMLLQRRNAKKYHSGGLWANACCSHPRVGETLEQAVERRLKEELGVEATADERFDFIYRASFENGLTEYEYDHVFVADYGGELYPAPEEIEALRWVGVGELQRDLVEAPERYAAWFLIAAPKVIQLLWGSENQK